MTKRLVVAGCGQLSSIVVEAYCKGYLPGYTLVGVLGRDPDKAHALAKKGGCKACFTQEEVFALQPDIIAEAASVALVKALALPALRRGISLAIISIGALADPEFYAQVEEAAAASGAKVHICSGAVGGFDVLRTMRLMQLDQQQEQKVTFVTRKGPQSLQNSPIFREEWLTATEEALALSGTAQEVIRVLPTKVNVSVAAALASVGTQQEQVSIYSVPGFRGDDHCITAEMDGIKAVIDIYSRTAHIAGWSIVSRLQNLTASIVF